MQIRPRTRLSRPTGYIPDKAWDILDCGPCIGGISLMFQRSLKKNAQVLVAVIKGFTPRTSQRGTPISSLDCFKCLHAPRPGVSPPALF